MVCKSTGEINYNCVGVGRSTKTSPKTLFEEDLPEDEFALEGKIPPAQPLFEDYLFRNPAQLLSEPQNHVKLSETFQILPEPSNLMRAQPCCHAATSEVLYGTSQPRSNLPEPQTAEPLQNQIFPELCNTSRMPRSFFLSSFLEQLSSVIFLTARVGHGDICYYSYAGGWLHSRFYSYCRGWLRKLVGYLEQLTNVVICEHIPCKNPFLCFRENYGKL